MKLLKSILFSGVALLMYSTITPAQNGQVVVYTDFNFQGANMALNGNWNGGGRFDRNIRSVRVPHGYKVTLYQEKNLRGTESPLTEDWTSFVGSPWLGNIRSIRVERRAIQPPPVQGDFPVIFAQANYQGPAEAIENGYAGRSDWEGHPHRIRSIRVPAGWKLTLYTERNYRGAETTITSNISWNAGDWWNGRARSIRAFRDNTPTPAPSSFPVIYSQMNYSGLSRPIDRDFAGSIVWNGLPNRIRSIRVPQGRPIMVYEKANYKGKSYFVTSDWAPQPGDWWYGKIRSIKLNPGPQPR
ncbi:MAG: peptidase inhibitor family I36 protein [Pyrinomonadaceae bacterium]